MKEVAQSLAKIKTETLIKSVERLFVTFMNHMDTLLKQAVIEWIKAEPKIREYIIKNGIDIDRLLNDTDMIFKLTRDNLDLLDFDLCIKAAPKPVKIMLESLFVLANKLLHSRPDWKAKFSKEKLIELMKKHNVPIAQYFEKYPEVYEKLYNYLCSRLNIQH